mmetsp:Transcript_9337/g.31238  ORF Transcript_9337/g.31238 Transcript_9337/m.31238 type:complete len:230 (-) Transcript_9337:50-739(-)
MQYFLCCQYLSSDELDGALAGDEVVVKHTSGGDHGKAAVLQLDELAAGEGVGVLGAVEGVKSEVSGLTVRSLEHLNNGNEAEDFDKSKPEEELLHGSLLDSSIVKRSHLGGTEGLGDSRELVDVLNNHSSGSKHADTSVLQLSLTKPAHVDDVGKAERVKANITNPGSIESRGALQEGIEVDGGTLKLTLLVELHGGTIASSGSPLSSPGEDRGGSEGSSRGGEREGDG